MSNAGLAIGQHYVMWSKRVAILKKLVCDPFTIWTPKRVTYWLTITRFNSYEKMPKNGMVGKIPTPFSKNYTNKSRTPLQLASVEFEMKFSVQVFIWGESWVIISGSNWTVFNTGLTYLQIAMTSHRIVLRWQWAYRTAGNISGYQFRDMKLFPDLPFNGIYLSVLDIHISLA